MPEEEKYVPTLHRYVIAVTRAEKLEDELDAAEAQAEDEREAAEGILRERGGGPVLVDLVDGSRYQLELEEVTAVRIRISSRGRVL